MPIKFFKLDYACVKEPVLDIKVNISPDLAALLLRLSKLVSTH